MQHNKKRYDYHYKVNELVMIKAYDPNKMEPRLHGPYPITECRTNGTVVVQRDGRGEVFETVNIQKLEPYKGPMVALCNERIQRPNKRRRIDYW